MHLGLNLYWYKDWSILHLKVNYCGTWYFITGLDVSFWKHQQAYDYRLLLIHHHFCISCVNLIVFSRTFWNVDTFVYIIAFRLVVLHLIKILNTIVVDVDLLNLSRHEYLCDTIVQGKVNTTQTDYALGCSSKSGQLAASCQIVYMWIKGLTARRACLYFDKEWDMYLLAQTPWISFK